MIATLPMYDWPETGAQTRAFWDAVRVRVPGLPDLSDHGETAWADPALVFSQTCWGPLRRGLLAQLRVLAQPDYGDVPGGRGAMYRSALVARSGRACPVPATPTAHLPDVTDVTGVMAFNDEASLSGWIAPVTDLGAAPTQTLHTGSHRASIRAVAKGRADWAAIDCRSWALALAHEPCARGLIVVGWTAERPGLPYVTARATPDAMAQALTTALFSMGAHAPKDLDP